jgi:hypothetical protein
METRHFHIGITHSMKYISPLALIIVAVIHLLPLVGVLGAARLTQLYGLPFDEPNLAIVMRHRAVLFGLLGVFCVVAAFKPQYQIAAYVAAAVSVGSFLLLALMTGGYNPQIARVVTADWVALLALAVGASAMVYERFRL